MKVLILARVENIVAEGEIAIICFQKSIAAVVSKCACNIEMVNPFLWTQSCS